MLFGHNKPMRLLYDNNMNNIKTNCKHFVNNYVDNLTRGHIYDRDFRCTIYGTDNRKSPIYKGLSHFHMRDNEGQKKDKVSAN